MPEEFDNLDDINNALDSAIGQPPAAPEAIEPPAEPAAPAPQPAPAAPSQVPNYEDFFAPEGTDDTPPAEPAAPAAPAPAAPAAPDNTATTREAEYQARLIEMDGRLRQMTDMLAAQNRQQAPAEPAAPADPTFFSAEESFDLTPEEQATYAASEPVINKLVRRAIKQYHDIEVAPVRSRMKEVQTTVQGSVEAAQSSAQRAMLAQVASAVPDWQERVNSPGWQSYLNQPLPFSGGGHRIRDALDAAYKAGNVASVQEILVSYAKPDNPTTKQVSPGSAQTTLPSTAPRGQRKFAYSRYAEASDKAQSGRMPYDEFEKIQDMYLDAMDKGLIDYNA